MARPKWRQPANQQVAQVWKATITTTTNGHTYTVTITDDNGDTAAITYTVANPPDTTVTLVAEGFIAAWNASLNPLIAKFTATNSAGQVILTADSAGRPFSLAASGTGTWSGDGNTTTPVSNNDYGQASNWTTDAVPTTGDDPVITGGSVGLLYGLNQSGVAVNAFVVEDSFTGQVGRIENGVLHYLRIDPDSFEYRGRSSLAAFDLGSAAIAVLLAGTGAPSAPGRNALYLKGSALTTATILSGNVGLAAADNDTATIATLLVGSDGQTTPVDVTLGAGLSLTTLRAAAGWSRQRCASTTSIVAPTAKWESEGSGAIGTLYAGGQCYPDSTGTITALHALGTGIVDFSRNRQARTVSTLTLYPGATVILHDQITVSAWAFAANVADNQNPIKIIRV
jgi:hypothetical protein